MDKNGQFINNELEWLSKIIVCRLNLYFGRETQQSDIEAFIPQPLSSGCAYSDFIATHSLGFEDRVFLALAFVPYVRSQLFDCFFIKNNSTGMRFSEFGGIVASESGRMTPTLGTFLFVVAGDDVEKRIELSKTYTAHPVFSGRQFVCATITGSTDFSISPAQELVENLLYERSFCPDFSNDFPANKITTTRQWSDLVLDAKTLEQLEFIKKWLAYGDVLMGEWGMRGKLKEGFRALFYGPSGTGKTMSASLLGKHTGRDVYCVDLSMIVSKYIGETEKNLSRIFDMAEGKGWILFFDEAEALFGKRTGIKDSHDRYANQEIAFLLQRVENYNGLVVLSTNMKANLDEAFARRFQSVIRFKIPDSNQREHLWRSTFPKNVIFEEGIDIEEISRKYELSGGSILNVVQYCSLMALGRNSETILLEDLLEGIRLEYRKDGRIAE